MYMEHYNQLGYLSLGYLIYHLLGLLFVIYIFLKMSSKTAFIYCIVHCRMLIMTYQTVTLILCIAVGH